MATVTGEPKHRYRAYLYLIALLTAVAFLAACAGEPAVSAPLLESPPPAATATVAVVPTTTALAPVPPTATVLPSGTSPLQASPTPFELAVNSPPCGVVLPLLPAAGPPLVETLEPDAAALAHLREGVPGTAGEALDFLLAYPQQVGLAAYRVGQEESGAYLNAGVPMPLASVVKVLHLVAYAEAVAAGELSATDTVWLEELEAFYLPGTDLGAHPEALASAEEAARLFGDPPAILLDEVPGMMIAASSNAATDYLHLLLGQERLEETPISLGLTSHTAPCPFLGQFLALSNMSGQADNDYQALERYTNDPASYGREVMLLTEAFSSDPAFRQQAIAQRQSFRSAGETQRRFFETLNAHASAADYAALMARIALNGLSDGQSSYIARRFLEWPMRFADNQALFSNLGYKNGSLPGILTTVYYAYPLGETTPVVVALFFHDLDSRTYRAWRDNLAHDELARWLLYEPEAIPALAAVLESPAN